MAETRCLPKSLYIGHDEGFCLTAAIGRAYMVVLDPDPRKWKRHPSSDSVTFSQKERTVSEQTVQTGLSDNAASGLAYVTFIPAIVFLVTSPYNQNRTIRFHCWQSIFLFVACIAVDIALGLLLHIPFLGFMTLLLWPLVGLAFFILWILCLIKAFNGQTFKLPIIGDLAEKQAGGTGL